MEFMRYAVYGDEGGEIEFAYDYEAIQWMRENVRGSPVIVEGASGGYSWGARFSIYTGLPTVIGWGWHQKQQRGEFENMVTEREKDLTDFYSSPTIEPAIDFLRKYRVQYVIIGELERLHYPAEGLAKFPAMSGRELDLVFQNEKVKIYKVVDLPPLMPSPSVKTQ
jgi:uncharacterized membrane protein